MKTDDFDYHLPPELIAQTPAPERPASRMLVLDRGREELEHRGFRDLPRYLRAGDLLVLNDTRVLPARLIGRKEATGGKVEFLLLEETRPGWWDVLLRAARRPPVGSRIELAGGRAFAVLEEDTGDRGRAVIRIECQEDFAAVLDEAGEPPLPPYIQRAGTGESLRGADRERYQTVYARVPGAVAAPTAGLHFTHEVLDELRAQGVEIGSLTLHVGLGTFRPVDAARVEDHTMEEERYEVSGQLARQVREARARGGRVVAVGSTSVRTLETAAAPDGTVKAGAGRSRLFIHPPYTFRAIDAMLTNFHLPRSTLLMMISALAGRDRVLRAYREAIEHGYRFYSYGDCMLIL